MIAKVSLFLAFLCYLLAAFDAHCGDTEGVVFMLFSGSLNAYFYSVFRREEI